MRKSARGNLNVALIGRAALDAGVPFLNIVQSCTWTSSMRVPTGDEMRYLVYTTLAHGAQGISYYIYTCANHTGGIANADSTPTLLCHALKPLNREFVAIARELQSLRSLGVFHAGMLPPGAEALPKDAAFTFDPDVPHRALSIYTMHRATCEQRFFDEEYWASYFDMLARNRFDSFVVVFGYENGGYFAPAYPCFFDVEGFPEVRVVDFTHEQQERYLKALKRMIALAHERSIDFTAGLWDHIYRGVTQYDDYRVVEMRRTGKRDEFEAVVLGDQIAAQWDFMYLFEVMDNNGNGKIYPDLETETPYIVVKLQR